MKNSGKNYSSSSRNKYSSRKYKGYILSVGPLLVIIAAGAFLTTGMIKYTSRSEFCINCHEMTPTYQTWQSSSHKNVECIKCHSDPGTAGLVRTKTNALKEVYLHVTGNYETPITISTDNAAFTNRCLGCHQGIKGKGEPHNNKHFEADIACTDCHQGMVHNEKTNRETPTREICIRCHGTEMGDS